MNAAGGTVRTVRRMVDTPLPPVSVVMPAYQLGTVIRDNVETVAAAVPAGSEIIVVDDGSDDDTATQAASADVPNLMVLTHTVNRGKGAALRTGGLAAAKEIVVLIDGDLDLPADQIAGMLERFDGLDVLVGTKRHDMGGGRYPLKRRVLSAVFRFVTKVLFRLPVSETQTGLKLFRRDVLHDALVELSTSRYAFDLELLVRARRAGATIGETPVRLRVGAASGSLQAGTLVQMALDTFRILWWTWTTP